MTSPCCLPGSVQHTYKHTWGLAGSPVSRVDWLRVPSVNSNGWPRSRELSNFVPSISVPV